MIRPFSLRDLPLVRRLSDQGTLLHAEAALTQSCQPLRGALFNMISRRDSATYIWREEEGKSAGFVQLYLPEDQPYAHLLCLGATTPDGTASATSPINETAWLSLLEGSTIAMGQRGVHSLIAEVAENGPELPVLRSAGFAVYTRQDIWIWRGPPGQHTDAGPGATLLELAGSVDEWDVEWLYANTVPPLIQLVEPTPPRDGEIWILREGGELTAFMHIQPGSVATWVQIFIHPSGYEQADEMVRAAIALSHRQSDTVYCCVRRYQSWLQDALVENGFQRCKSQAVMVKHIATPALHKAGELSKLLKTHRAQATSLLEEYGRGAEQQPTLAQD